MPTLEQRCDSEFFIFKQIKFGDQVSDTLSDHRGIGHLIAPAQNHHYRNFVFETNLEHHFIPVDDPLLTYIEVSQRITSHTVSAGIVYQELRLKNLHGVF